MSAIPSVDRTLELLERGQAGGVTVLGWADDMVAAIADVAGSEEEITFTVAQAPRRSHEDEVLIVAIRVPHPEEMPLADVVGEELGDRPVQPETIPPSMILERVEWIDSLRQVASVAADNDDHDQADMLNEMADFLAAAPIAFICEAGECWAVGSQTTESGERYCPDHFPA